METPSQMTIAIAAIVILGILVVCLLAAANRSRSRRRFRNLTYSYSPPNYYSNPAPPPPAVYPPDGTVYCKSLGGAIPYRIHLLNNTEWGNYYELWVKPLVDPFRLPKHSGCFRPRSEAWYFVHTETTPGPMRSQEEFFIASCGALAEFERELMSC